MSPNFDKENKSETMEQSLLVNEFCFPNLWQEVKILFSDFKLLILMAKFSHIRQDFPKI